METPYGPVCGGDPGKCVKDPFDSPRNAFLAQWKKILPDHLTDAPTVRRFADDAFSIAVIKEFTNTNQSRMGKGNEPIESGSKAAIVRVPVKDTRDP
jgi:hypothetical protein